MNSTFDIDTFNPAENMFIEASAGTGKTYTITSIVKKLVNQYKIPLKKILIVTYTEKATGELRNRIREVLPKEDVDNASIYTIHSFCQSVLKEFAYTAEQPYVLDIADDVVPKEFIQKWIRDELKSNIIFKKIYENQKTIADGITTVLPSIIKKYYLNSKYEEDPSVVELNKTVIKTANFEFDYTKLDDLFSARTINDYDKIFPKFKENLEAVENVGKRYGTVATKTANEPFKYYKEFAENIEKRIQNGVVEIIEKKPSVSAANTDINNLGAAGPAALQYFAELKSLIYSSSSETESIFTNKRIYLEYLSGKLYKCWLEEKKNRKLQSFGDMIRSVRESVCEKDSALRKSIQNNYTYAIIDEFQDTNQLQWDIFSKVFMDTDAEEPHSIYVVGDPKQSIYAFQNADVNVYLKATHEIENNGGVKRILDTNWRSTPSMITACNKLFSDMQYDSEKKSDCFFMNNDGFSFVDSKKPEDLNKQSKNALYNNEQIEPLWIRPDTSTFDFADVVAKEIVDCCSVDDKGNTKLQIWDKDINSYRNVNFSDFVVLGQARYEFSSMEEALKKRGIPFARYKDTNLFNGMECAHWISLFNAIAANDFTNTNRRILSEVLFSKFFNIELSEVQNKKYDSPVCKERQFLYKWHSFAEKREWAKMIESIFTDTNIEEKLSSLDQIQVLSKFRQIGNYSVDYLYKNNCALEDLIKHLNKLSNNLDADGEDENLVSRGTDFKCVQFMTIHSSKGLEFPVVISLAGLKKVRTKESSYFYHIGKGAYKKAVLSLSKPESNNEEELDQYTLEAYQELERLLYVAMTRAKAIMILPMYGSWDEVTLKDDEEKEVLPEFHFLKSAYKNFMQDKKNEKLFRILDNVPDIKMISIEKIIGAQSNSELFESITKDEQVMNNSSLSGKLPHLATVKSSYSSLSHGKKAEKVMRLKDGTKPDSETTADEKHDIDLSSFDEKGIQIICNYDASKKMEMISENYPAGAKLGTAMHEVFEKVDFVNGCTNESDLNDLINTCFANAGFVLDEDDSKKIRAQSAVFVNETLQAVLPEIKGSGVTGKSFSLNELPVEKRLAEIEFNFIAKLGNNNQIRNYCNGFVDLVFVRETENGKLYSILDWKSDLSWEDENFYSDIEGIKEHTDQHYSVQRVLYSYCLIKWLKGFEDYKDKTEEQIFNENYGGIYYVYFRGCINGIGNGIYAHTWSCWDDLKAAYEKICKKLM